MLATECQYCNVKSYLTCCFKVPLQKPLKVICEPCLRDVMHRTSGHIPCPICLDPSSSDDVRIQQILTREQNLKKNIGLSQLKSSAQKMPSWPHVPVANSASQLPMVPKKTHSSSFLSNMHIWDSSPMHQSRGISIHDFAGNKKNIYGSSYIPHPNAKQRRSIFDIPEEPSDSLSPEQLKAFNDALNAPIDDDARLAFERKKGGVEKKKEIKKEEGEKKREGQKETESIDFSDTSTYRDLQL